MHSTLLRLSLGELASASPIPPLLLPLLLWLTGVLRRVASPSSPVSSLLCHRLGGSPFSFSRVAWKVRRRRSLLPTFLPVLLTSSLDGVTRAGGGRATLSSDTG